MELIAKMLYGSQNYGLDNDDSDKDYCLLVMPSSADLYHSIHGPWSPPAASVFDKNFTSDHYTTVDARAWFARLNSGNPNSIEMLFSVEGNNNYNANAEIAFAFARNAYRNGYLMAEFESFYRALKGMAFSHNKPNDNKCMARLQFFTTFLLRVIDNDFCVNENLFVQDAYARAIRYYEAPCLTVEEYMKQWEQLFVEACKKVNEFKLNTDFKPFLTDMSAANNYLYLCYNNMRKEN